MSEWKLQTPVAFIIFNRPDTTERVFAEIAKARPPKLLVVADGPRANRPGEAEKCVATRDIIKRVDWDCEVLTNFSDTNLGCKRRVSSGIDWVFEQVAEAIILEDDCLPHPTFFRFCEELLERYRDDEHVAMISGDNFQSGQRRGDASYYFSRYTHIWGWASWRRAWQHYDVAISAWPQFRDEAYLEGFLRTPAERRYWAKVFQAVYEGRIDTWDYQWGFTAWQEGMLSIMPNGNLSSNIGFGSEATHTKGASPFANLSVSAMEFPLRHPKIFQAHHMADHHESKTMFTSSLARRIINKLTSIIGHQ